MQTNCWRFRVNFRRDESHLVEGRQDLKSGQTLEDLVYGQSITDGCIGWEDSEKALFALAEAVEERRRKHQK